MAFKESEIQKMMQKLQLTREEAIQLLQDDEDDISVDLTAEQKKVAKEMLQADRKKEKTPRKRERKPNEDKRSLISKFIECLGSLETLDVVNPEREFVFTYNGEKYRVTLMKPREK